MDMFPPPPPLNLQAKYVSSSEGALSKNLFFKVIFICIVTSHCKWLICFVVAGQETSILHHLSHGRYQSRHER